VTFAEGDWISVDGSTGEVFLGSMPTSRPASRTSPTCQTILDWADGIRRMGSGPTPTSPRRRPWPGRYGAQGIGLCRTEHMFREGERLEIVRDAILVANAATRAKERRRPAKSYRAEDAAIVARFDAAMGKLENASSKATSRASSRRWTACRSWSA
jgi:pyruvate,orthophosphate dikinase